MFLVSCDTRSTQSKLIATKPREVSCPEAWSFSCERCSIWGQYSFIYLIRPSNWYLVSYQVRTGQLQAGNYGTPQRRVRFFIVAAKEGHVLPDFPEPTHDFPENKTLQITVKVGSKSHSLSPVRFADGIAQHPFVNVADAIFDLPRFDWYACIWPASSL